MKIYKHAEQKFLNVQSFIFHSWYEFVFFLNNSVKNIVIMYNLLFFIEKCNYEKKLCKIIKKKMTKLY